MADSCRNLEFTIDTIGNFPVGVESEGNQENHLVHPSQRLLPNSNRQLMHSPDVEFLGISSPNSGRLLTSGPSEVNSQTFRYMPGNSSSLDAGSMRPPFAPQFYNIDPNTPLLDENLRLGVPPIDESPGDVCRTIASPKFYCFNCLGPHLISACPLPSNPSEINKNRNRFRNSQGQRRQNTSTRYMDNDMENPTFIPGNISDHLKRAMGLIHFQVPLHIYRMRQYGYPPGHLEASRSSRSGLILHDGLGSQDNANRGYDRNKFYSFPGFNTPMPRGALDETKRHGAPPFSPKQSIDLYWANMQLQHELNESKRRSIRKREIDTGQEDEAKRKIFKTEGGSGWNRSTTLSERRQLRQLPTEKLNDKPDIIIEPEVIMETDTSLHDMDRRRTNEQVVHGRNGNVDSRFVRNPFFNPLARQISTTTRSNFAQSASSNFNTSLGGTSTQATRSSVSGTCLSISNRSVSNMESKSVSRVHERTPSPSLLQIQDFHSVCDPHLPQPDPVPLNGKPLVEESGQPGQESFDEPFRCNFYGTQTVVVETCEAQGIRVGQTKKEDHGDEVLIVPCEKKSPEVVILEDDEDESLVQGADGKTIGVESDKNDNNDCIMDHLIDDGNSESQQSVIALDTVCPIYSNGNQEVENNEINDSKRATESQTTLASSSSSPLIIDLDEDVSVTTCSKKDEENEILAKDGNENEFRNKSIRDEGQNRYLERWMTTRDGERSKNGKNCGSHQSTASSSSDRLYIDLDAVCPADCEDDEEVQVLVQVRNLSKKCELASNTQLLLNSHDSTSYVSDTGNKSGIDRSLGNSLPSSEEPVVLPSKTFDESAVGTGRMNSNVVDVINEDNELGVANITATNKLNGVDGVSPSIENDTGNDITTNLESDSECMGMLDEGFEQDRFLPTFKDDGDKKYNNPFTELPPMLNFSKDMSELLLHEPESHTGRLYNVLSILKSRKLKKAQQNDTNSNPHDCS